MGWGREVVTAVFRAVRRLLRFGSREPIEGFEGSSVYWERRYAAGGNSGPGSYGDLALFKARILNEFVATQNVRSIIEFGCGDGHQLSLARYPTYLGLDVSQTAIARCKTLFASDASKEFRMMEDYKGELADASFSLDVIYHLVEDAVYERYMTTLFSGAQNWVVIYSSNFDGVDEKFANHVRHRKFTNWIDVNCENWHCSKVIRNRFSFTGDFRFSRTQSSIFLQSEKSLLKFLARALKPWRRRKKPKYAGNSGDRYEDRSSPSVEMFTARQPHSIRPIAHENSGHSPRDFPPVVGRSGIRCARCEGLGRSGHKRVYSRVGNGGRNEGYEVRDVLIGRQSYDRKMFTRSVDLMSYMRWMPRGVGSKRGSRHFYLSTAMISSAQILSMGMILRHVSGCQKAIVSTIGWRPVRTQVMMRRYLPRCRVNFE